MSQQAIEIQSCVYHDPIFDTRENWRFKDPLSRYIWNTGGPEYVERNFDRPRNLDAGMSRARGRHIAS